MKAEMLPNFGGNPGVGPWQALAAGAHGVANGADTLLEGAGATRACTEGVGFTLGYQNLLDCTVPRVYNNNLQKSRLW